MEPRAEPLMNGHHKDSHKKKRRKKCRSGQGDGTASDGHERDRPGPGAGLNGVLRETARQLKKQREALPIFSARNAIIDEIKKNDTVVIVGETGSGKTTQIPQYLLEADVVSSKPHSPGIAVTQPRKVAATSIARRVAAEVGVPLGRLVGYSVRFEPKFSRDTRIKYATDGMLLRELLSDPLLRSYRVVILDEAHERTLRTDILFGMLKDIQKRRKDPADAEAKALGELKIVVMSATLDAEKFSAYFGGARILYVAGRQFPVKQFHTPEPQEDYVDSAMVAVFQIHREQAPGDILVFLSGQDEIEALEKLLNENSVYLPPEQSKLLVVPLFAALPGAQQAKAFEPTPRGMRKCVIATNVAETSVTIPGIRYVVDTGVAKVRSFDSRIGLESLVVREISKASARQRAGRAGREAPGCCFRLYTERDFGSLDESTVPEIQRVNLASAALQLKACGVDDVQGFDFMDPPSRGALIRALEQLYSLGALGDDGKLTELGKQMAAFPLDPPYAKVVISSARYGCTEEIVTIVAMLSVENLFHTPSDRREEVAETRSKFVSYDGDHLTLLAAARGYEAEADDKAAWCKAHFVNHRAMKQAMQIREQLKDLCKETGIDPAATAGDDRERVLRAILGGFVQNVAFRQPDGSYRTVVNNQIVAIHPSSVLHNKRVPCIVYNELLYTNRQYMRTVSRIEMGWMLEAAPNYYGRRSMDSHD
ncbi:P-loop containing nucleoside triphosphate hydrolase protein [Hyaloraphidium curvatum]|nr:P-loop containing nucleoside triphosphate hydrolase protein [Hyaloraphidium curvatum]